MAGAAKRNGKVIIIQNVRYKILVGENLSKMISIYLNIYYVRTVD